MPRTTRASRFSADRWFPPILGILIVLSPLAPAAQTSDARSLADQVQRLQRELTDLQRQVYGGAAGVEADAAGGGSIAARQEIRLQELENELRELTGKIEQATFGVRQITDRLDRLVEDVDFRLRALEQGADATPMAQAPDGTASAQSETGASGQADAGASGTAGEPRTLGVLSQRQLEAFENRGRSEARQAMPTAAPPDPQGRTPEEQYDYAFGLLRRANYAEAEGALKSFVERHPEHRLAGNAQYWLGETYYVRGDYTRAAVTFAEGYQKYPKGSKAADNLLKLGMSLAEIGRTEDACRAFAELELQFPDAPANLKERAAGERQRRGC